MKNFAIMGLVAAFSLAFTFSAMAIEAGTMTKSELNKEIQQTCKASKDARACSKQASKVKSKCNLNTHNEACKAALSEFRSVQSE